MALAIDLYCGLGGWTDGLLAEGYDVIGFDNERHVYGDMKYPAQLVVQDVLTLHGRQFKSADLIVASPPCTEYSYMAMPWSRAKQIAAALRGKGKFPDGYDGSRTIDELNRLFDACFRIQREAIEAAGRHIPLVVENVVGAQAWVGQAATHFGSYYLWGDVPIHWRGKGIKHGGGGLFHDTAERAYKSEGLNWSDREKRGQDFTRLAGEQARKNSGGSWFRVAHNTTSGKGRNPDGRNPAYTPHMTNPAEHEASGIKQGGDWFNSSEPSISRKTGSKSPKRKMASALIAKIPLSLSRHIAMVYHPGVAA